MIKDTGKALASFLAVLALGMMIGATSAKAQKVDYGRAINLTGMQRMLTQKMAKEALLVALAINEDQNLENLEASRSLFRRTLTGLREGDMELGLLPTTDPQILEKLEKVEEIWPLYNTTIQDALDSGSVSESQLARIVELNVPLLKAVSETIMTYKLLASHGALNSMLGSAIDHAGRQVMLSQKMSKEFLLIASGHDIERNRRNLEETAALFDRTLTALLEGNAEMRILPAPNPEINGQLRKVQQIWMEFRPLLDRALGGKETDAAAMAQVARMNTPLLKAMNMVVFMYESL